MKFPLFPSQASTSAAQVDALYLFLTVMSVGIMMLIFLPMLYFLFKYRRGNKAYRGPIGVSSLKIELTWTFIPLVIALGIFAWSAHIYFNLRVPPVDSLAINVIGKQWMWKVQHQEGRKEINALHVPLGRNVKITLASEDVIHSFYIPAFRLKQDAVPGRFTTVWFHPTRLGTYHMFCAEYCGTDHSRMIGTVYVMSPEDYQSWLARGAPGETLAESGARLFRELGCSGCHMGSSIVRAPRLEGIYQKNVPLQSGGFVVADDKYLRDSILLPTSQVAAGYEPLMPTFQGRITEAELLQIIAYLKSLKSQPPDEMP